MKRSRFAIAVQAGVLALLGACGSLDVENPNDPDFTRALASGEDVKKIAIASIHSWYLASTDLYLYTMLMVTADANTSNCCYGRFSNVEPRLPFENTSGGGDRAVVEKPWDDNYATLAATGDVIRAIDAGVRIADGVENEKYRALAMFAQAASFSNLALIFDSAFVVDESVTRPAAPVLRPYAAVSAAALAKWDALIAYLADRTDSYAPSVLPIAEFTLSSANLRTVANTMAGLTLRLTARTPAELNAQPASFWNRILAYARAGITTDVTVLGDGENWYSYLAAFGSDASWLRVDYRKINRMDAAGGGANPVPFRYNGANDIRPPSYPASNDQRLGDGGPGRDYRYHANVIGDAGRGVYMQSAYSSNRYAGHGPSSPTRYSTPVPYLLKAENDLLVAEALVKTGGHGAEAAALINTTRVGRGGLPALTGLESSAAMLAAIDYERDVELAATNGFELFYARSAPTTTPLSPSAAGGRIQTGTVRHLPVPAKEREALGLPVYTYGGAYGYEMIVVGGGGERLRLRHPPRPTPPSTPSFDWR